MSILKRTAFTELVAAITDEESGEVEIALAGFESKYNLYFSTREVAIADLRAVADWLEGQENSTGVE
jgi:hypothetical protein